MPHKTAAYKEIRKSKKRHARNISIKTDLKTIVKKLERLIADKKYDEAKKSIASVVSTLNKSVSKGIIHKNAASRKISRLTKRLNALAKT